MSACITRHAAVYDTLKTTDGRWREVLRGRAGQPRPDRDGHAAAAVARDPDGPAGAPAAGPPAHAAPGAPQPRGRREPRLRLGNIVDHGL